VEQTARDREVEQRSDAELVAAVVDGDQTAFAILFDRHRASVRQHLLGILREAAAADDLTQEVFLRLWDRAGQWKAEAALRSWLLRIATNLALNHLRTVKRRREQAIELPPIEEDDEEESPVPAWMIDDTAPRPDQVLDRTERRRLLDRSVAQLSEEKREVVRRVYEDHMEAREVAAELGIPEGTVKSRMHHARKEMARSWQELGIEWEDL